MPFCRPIQAPSTVNFTAINRHNKVLEDLAFCRFFVIMFNSLHLMRQALFFLAAAFCFGCSESRPSENPSERASEDSSVKLRVVCTTGMVADMVGVLCGPDADVDFVIPTGLDPHTYRATPSDVERIMEADVVVYSGIGLEAKFEDILENYGRGEGHSVLSLGQGLPAPDLIVLGEGEGHEGEVDPHFWFDIDLWKLAATSLSKELSSLDPEHANAFNARLAQYLQELDNLDLWCRQELDNIAPSDRVMVTVHDAFAYFARHFGFEVRGLQGISPELEAGVYDVSNMVNYLVDNNIQAVFVEESLPTKTMEAVVKGCASKGHDVSIGEPLLADNVGVAGSEEGTYIGMVKYNVNALVLGLTK